MYSHADDDYIYLGRQIYFWIYHKSNLSLVTVLNNTLYHNATLNISYATGIAVDEELGLIYISSEGGSGSYGTYIVYKNNFSVKTRLQTGTVKDVAFDEDYIYTVESNYTAVWYKSNYSEKTSAKMTADNPMVMNGP